MEERKAQEAVGVRRSTLLLCRCVDMALCRCAAVSLRGKHFDDVFHVGENDRCSLGSVGRGGLCESLHIATLHWHALGSLLSTLEETAIVIGFVKRTVRISVAKFFIVLEFLNASLRPA